MQPVINKSNGNVTEIISLLMSQAEEKPFSCPIHGAVTVWIEVGSNDNGICRKCEEDQQKRERLELLKKEREEMVSMTGVEPRFTNFDYRDFKAETAELKKALASVLTFGNNFADHNKRGEGVVLTGFTGNGKTMLGSLLTNQVSRKGYSARYIPFYSLIGELYSTYTNDDMSEMDVMEKYTDYDLIVIDEVGSKSTQKAQGLTDSEKNRLEQLIDQRYARLKSTVIISNCSFSELKQFVGERVVSRLQQDCKGRVIGFNGKDWRAS